MSNENLPIHRVIIVEALRYSDNKRFSIICSDATQGTEVFNRLCSVVGLDGETKKTSANGTQYLTNFKQVKSTTSTTGKTMVGIGIEMRGTFLYGSYSHIPTEEEIGFMEDFVKGSFSTEVK